MAEAATVCGGALPAVGARDDGLRYVSSLPRLLQAPRPLPLICLLFHERGKDAHFSVRRRYLSDEGRGVFRACVSLMLWPMAACVRKQRPQASRVRPENAGSHASPRPAPELQLEPHPPLPCSSESSLEHSPSQYTPILTLVGLRKGAGPKRPAPSPLTQPFPHTAPTRGQREIGGAEAIVSAS